MSQLGKLTIAVVRNLGRLLRARGVVVLALDDENIAVGTWGKRKRDCDDMARLGDSLLDAIQHGIFATWRKRNAAGKIVSDADYTEDA